MKHHEAKPAMNEYLFDLHLFATLRIKARSQEEARKLLAEALDCATVNFGSINGEPLIGEASLYDDEEPVIAEVNGEAC